MRCQVKSNFRYAKLEIRAQPKGKEGQRDSVPVRPEVGLIHFSPRENKNKHHLLST